MDKKHILLLIEDNPLLTGMYKAAFEKRGMEVFFAHDGAEGLRLAKEKKPHMALVDLLMPGIGGFEVLKQIKSDPEIRHIKVIMLTILNQEENMQKAKELGAIDYLIKSELKLNEIVDKVLAHLE